MVVRQFHAILLFLILFVACKAQQQPDEARNACFKMLSDALSADFHYEFNADQSMVLATSSPNAAGMSRLLVLRVNSQAILLDQLFRPGSAKWLNKDEIELISLPGTLQENEPNTKTILKPNLKL